MKTITFDETKWKLVPVESTPEMEWSWNRADVTFTDGTGRRLPHDPHSAWKSRYAALLAATPAAPSQPAVPQLIDAARKDAIFQASIDFIGALTGMAPPPIEVAPPEVFKPFRDFTEKVCTIVAAPSQEPDNCRKRPRCGLDDPCAWTTKREPSQESVTDEVLESLRECVNSLWVIDSHVVEFDGTVHFGPYYDFSGLDGIDRHEFLAEHSCVVWPSGGKWSAYCTYDGTTWFELFDSADAAKEKCMGLLDRVMPAHPAMKARAIIAALRAKEQS